MFERATRELSRPGTAPTWPSQARDGKSRNLSQCTADAPDGPRSRSMASMSCGAQPNLAMHLPHRDSRPAALSVRSPTCPGTGQGWLSGTDARGKGALEQQGHGARPAVLDVLQCQAGR